MAVQSNDLKNVLIDSLPCWDPLGDLYQAGIDGETYERSINETLGQIGMNPVGRLLFNIFANAAGHQTTITPTAALPGSYDSLQETDTEVDPNSPSAPDNPYPQYAPRADPDTDEVIHFIPQSWLWGDQRFARGKSCRDDDANFKPDDVLFHEMIHALRRMRGLHRRDVFEDIDPSPYDNSEEFAAIIITNIYVQVCNPPRKIRGSHDLSFAEEKNRNLRTFYSLYSTQIGRLYNEMKDLAPALADFDVEWNPFRQYRYPEKYMFD